MQKHQPVLLHEVLTGLSIHKGDTVVDATVGDGGYTKAFCDAVGKDGTVIGIDQDENAINRVQEKLKNAVCTLYLKVDNFRYLGRILKGLGVSRVDAIAFDLGMSSVQLEESGRGFSFQKDEPLTMTFKRDPRETDITASQIVNVWSEESIANVLFGYGGERFSRKIARAIVARRKEKEIKTTSDLVDIIESVLPRRGHRRGGVNKIHPATRSFQALRIAVNDELEAITEGLAESFSLLVPNGRIAVVSFHSLEDRIVKHFFRTAALDGKGIVLTKKIIKPSEEESKNNPRSRSAKLRIFQKK